jgi:enoyl-CoA hydratase
MGDDGSVRVERNGPVTTVILSRPEARNAVDRPTAEALVAAFRAFDEEPEAAAAVLWGEGGHFCAGGVARFQAGAGRHGAFQDP